MTTTTAPAPLAPGVLRLARGLMHVLEAVSLLLGAVTWLLQGATRIISRCWKALPVAVAGVVVMTLNTASCGPLDLDCKIDAWQAGWLEGLTATFGTLTHSMIEGVFTSQVSTINAATWNVGLLSVNRLAAVMAIVVVGLCSIQIIMTLVAKQRAGIVRAVAGAVLAWPVCAVSVILAIQLVRFADQLAEQIIAGSTALATLGALTDMAWVTSVTTGNAVGVAMSSLFFLFCIFIPTVLLTIVMAFRNYALVVAISVAPVSLMTWGLKALQGMARGWAKITVALILTKPVMALSIMIAGEMVAAGLTGGGIGPFMTGVVGMFVAAASPATAMAMVTGAMAIADSGVARGMEGAGANAAQKVGRGAARLGRKAGREGFDRLGGKEKVDQATSAVSDTIKAKTGSFFSRSESKAPPATAGAPEPSGTGKSGPKPTGASEAGQTAGSTAGGAAGAAAGSALPGVGTAVGREVGSHVGGQVGQQAGSAVDKGAEAAGSATSGGDALKPGDPTQTPSPGAPPASGTGAGAGAGETAGGQVGKTAGQSAGGAAGAAVGSAVPGVGTAIGQQVGAQAGAAVGESVGSSAGGALDSATSGGGAGGQGTPSAQPIFAPGSPRAAPPAAAPSATSPAPQATEEGVSMTSTPTGAATSSGDGAGTSKAAGGPTRGGADLSGGLK